MRNDHLPPPRRPVEADRSEVQRHVLRIVASLLGLALGLAGIALLLWYVSMGLVGLASAFASTGAHAGLAVALTVLACAAVPLGVAVAAVLFRGRSRER